MFSKFQMNLCKNFLTKSKQSNEDKYRRPDHESSYPSHDDDPDKGKDHG
jgi:hypothetical protein